MDTYPDFRDAGLRKRVRGLIEQGSLPVAPPTQRMAAGYGTGHTCSACDEQITGAQMEYEVESRHSALVSFGMPLDLGVGVRAAARTLMRLVRR